ncbi:hypothetical protein Aau02nite_43950 [Amorphoplanes auranticolor]|uniref:Uncharacterized protein n=1 Tax=Actinoplanes auranticolor TaxID=47988 RepID=A0A919SE95_9ACTN|nr:hypothetical protein Aau02nite_43950 [Actinoplanes auranticolor]
MSRHEARLSRRYGPVVAQAYPYCFRRVTEPDSCLTEPKTIDDPTAGDPSPGAEMPQPYARD